MQSGLSVTCVCLEAVWQLVLRKSHVCPVRADLTEVAVALIDCFKGPYAKCLSVVNPPPLVTPSTVA